MLLTIRRVLLVLLSALLMLVSGCAGGLNASASEQRQAINKMRTEVLNQL